MRNGKLKLRKAGALEREWKCARCTRGQRVLTAARKQRPPAGWVQRGKLIYCGKHWPSQVRSKLPKKDHGPAPFKRNLHPDVRKGLAARRQRVTVDNRTLPVKPRGPETAGERTCRLRIEAALYRQDGRRRNAERRREKRQDRRDPPPPILATAAFGPIEAQS